MKIVTAIPVKHTPDHVAPEILEQEDPDTLYIENMSDVPSLCSKLNTALEWAKEKGADWLIFRHTDTTIETPELIEPQLELAYRNGVRVCGVIGSLIADNLSWWMNPRPICTWGGIMQGYSNGEVHPMVDQPGFNANLALIDGCFMVIHKDMFDVKVREYHNHMYDSFISLAALALGYKVACIDVRVRHMSEGKFDPAEMEKSKSACKEDWKQWVDFAVLPGHSQFKEGVREWLTSSL